MIGSLRADVVALLCVVLAAGSARADVVSSAPVGGQLARAVLLQGPELEAAAVPDELAAPDRQRLLAYIERRARFTPRRGAAAVEIERFGRQTALEREIASVIEQEGIEAEAAAVVNGAPLAADPATSPSAEAEWAEGVLRARPGSMAAPYLYAFLASRYRLMFEQLPEDDVTALERLARKYRTMLERVRGSDDRLMVILAEDLDGLPVLSRGATRHPRTYLPDT